MPTITTTKRYNATNFYSIANPAVTGTSGVALEVIAASTGRLRIVSFHVFQTAGTASIFGFGRPAAKGTTPGGTKNFLQMQTGGTSAHTTAVSWGGAPTQPSEFFFRAATAATNGLLLLWQPDDLWVPPNGTFVMWNLAANSATNVTVTIESSV